MEPKIESKSAFTVVGMKCRGKNEKGEIPALWQELMPRIREIRNLATGGESFGVMDNYDEASGNFDYIAALGVSTAQDLPEGMVSWDVPAQKYVVFGFEFANVREASQESYASLPDLGYKHAAGPEFEYYPAEFDPNKPESLMYLYIPIE